MSVRELRNRSPIEDPLGRTPPTKSFAKSKVRGDTSHPSRLRKDVCDPVAEEVRGRSPSVI